MSEIRTLTSKDLNCNLKSVAAESKCQQKTQQQLKKHSHPPIHLIARIEDTRKCEGDKLSLRNGGDFKHNSHDIDKVYSNGSAKEKGYKQLNKHEVEDTNGHKSLYLKGVKSRELRGGIMYTGCGCLRRDGLQDCCPRTECRDQGHCLTKPWADCPPARLFRSRHPELFGQSPDSNVTNCN